MRIALTALLLVSVLVAQVPAIDDSLAIYNIRTMMGKSGLELRKASDKLYVAFGAALLGSVLGYAMLSADDPAVQDMGVFFMVPLDLSAVVFTLLAYKDIADAGKALGEVQPSVSR